MNHLSVDPINILEKNPSELETKIYLSIPYLPHLKSLM